MLAVALDFDLLPIEWGKLEPDSGYFGDRPHVCLACGWFVA